METEGAARTWDMRISGTGAREPAGHRLRPNHFLFLAPEGGERTRLGGEMRRGEQLSSWAGMSTDRDATVDDLSEGVFHMPPPLAQARQESHKSRGQAGSPRPSQAHQP
jgi:hypothetical protein